MFSMLIGERFELRNATVQPKAIHEDNF